MPTSTVNDRQQLSTTVNNRQQLSKLPETIGNDPEQPTISVFCDNINIIVKYKKNGKKNIKKIQILGIISRTGLRNFPEVKKWT